MKDVSQVTALVYDNSLFLPLARKLAQTYKRVLYFTPWEEAFPTLNKCIIGDGFTDVERCNDIWRVKNEVDVFIFPDIQHSGLQLELESQGCNVWGSRACDSLETNRQKFHRVLEDIGLKVPTFEEVVGLDELRKVLEDAEDRYIKVSKYRGSFETFHWRSMDEDEGMLDVWAVRFGPAKSLVKFMVFDPIDTPLEIGGDTFCVDGKWPSLMLHGDEQKDKGYLASVTKREDMPEQIQKVLEAFSPVLEAGRYRNQWSMELRDDYFIDACTRGGLPSTGAQMEVWENLPEIIYAGSQGELVEPMPADNFVAECILTLKGEKTAWGKTRIPDEIDEYVKLAGCCMIDGAYCFPPHHEDGDEVGWLVTTGSTIEQTVERMKELSSALPEGLTAHTESLIDLLVNIKKGEAEGVEFSDQKIPSPEIVLETD